MNIHSRAKTCPESRALLVRRVRSEAWSMDQASAAVGVSVQTVRKWMRRYEAEGVAGLADRSSRPHRSPNRLAEDREHVIISLRKEYRLPAVVLAAELGISRSTVGRVLRRHGLSRAKDLEPRAPVVRYEHPAPGELIHLDIKKLGRIHGVGHRIHGDLSKRNRGQGWEFLHIAIDDFSRLAYLEILSDEKAATTVGFLERALLWYRNRGIDTLRVLTDNGPAYTSLAFAALCRAHGLRHRRTRPYTPRTNGKAERFIQTALREWAYRYPYASSARRREVLPHWMHFYNHHRRHSALAGQPPVSRVNNLLATNT